MIKLSSRDIQTLKNLDRKANTPAAKAPEMRHAAVELPPERITVPVYNCTDVVISSGMAVQFADDVPLQYEHVPVSAFSNPAKPWAVAASDISSGGFARAVVTGAVLVPFGCNPGLEYGTCIMPAITGGYSVTGAAGARILYKRANTALIYLSPPAPIYEGAWRVQFQTVTSGGGVQFRISDCICRGIGLNGVDSSSTVIAETQWFPEAYFVNFSCTISGAVDSVVTVSDFSGVLMAKIYNGSAVVSSVDGIYGGGVQWQDGGIEWGRFGADVPLCFYSSGVVRQIQYGAPVVVLNNALGHYGN